MQVLLFLHRLYFFVILNIRNKKTYKMKKIIFLFIISSLISIKGIGLTLSPETEVSILTCAPGNELYSLFGHTAIRINDPRHQIDRVYNYGTFDFSTPHFYLKYARGLLPYQLTVQKFSHFIYNYQLEERTLKLSGWIRWKNNGFSICSKRTCSRKTAIISTTFYSIIVPPEAGISY